MGRGGWGSYELISSSLGGGGCGGVVVVVWER